MGTSSTALFSDDVACDIRDEFVELLSSSANSADITQFLMKTRTAEIQDADDGPVFWLALAATQWKYGCLIDDVQARAINIIDSGIELQRWDGRSATRRAAVLLSLKETLLSPQPKPRRPSRRKSIVVPSQKVMAPDGRAQATAYELGRSIHPAAPRMQIYIEMEASGSRGGGGVCLADCEFSDVVMVWLDSDTLHVTFPKSAGVGHQSASSFYCGRTINIIYARQEVT
jgi:hypothetical protein